MSLFRLSDYTGKKETVHKSKLPTQNKTKKHKCSQCERTDAIRYPISEKEVRWLCPDCVTKHQRKDDKEKPNFIKANKLYRRTE